MSQRIRRVCRRRAIALSAIGIGSWGRAAHALDTVRLKVGNAAIEVSFVPGELDLSHTAPCWTGFVRQHPPQRFITAVFRSLGP
jgi:hypothetical protein